MVGIIFTYNLPKQKIPSYSLFVHPQLNKHCFFSHWDGKQETMLIQNLGGQTKSIMVFSASANFNSLIH